MRWLLSLFVSDYLAASFPHMNEYYYFLPQSYYADLHDNHAAQSPQWSTSSLTPAQLGLYYRIMVFIPANIYPCITLGDFPERFVKVPQKQAQVPAEIVYGWAREQGRENRKRMFELLEGFMFRSESDTGGQIPYAVGSAGPTLADVYIAMVAHYAPRPRSVLRFSPAFSFNRASFNRAVGLRGCGSTVHVYMLALGRRSNIQF